MIETLDAIVVGAGEAGAVVASRAVADGYRVAMIYREPYGSTCVNFGCVSSKFLIHRANVAHTVRTSSRFHVGRHGEPSVDLAAIVSDMNALVDEHRSEAVGNTKRALRLTLIEGSARFVAPHELAVGNRRLRAERVFIATGMSPHIPDIAGIDDVEVHTSETIMKLIEVPEHLVVIGGGYLGCELGQAYRRFGSRVTVIQGPAALCPDEEPDVSRILATGLRADGIELMMQSRAIRLMPTSRGVRVLAVRNDGAELLVEGSHLLIAAGRRANTDALGIEAAGVALRADGSIPVDDRMRTNIPGIWAVGDVNGKQPFTRVCQEEAKVAFADAFEGRNARIDRLSLGHGIFTDPEIGSVGLTEIAARRAGYDAVVGLVTFDSVEKAELTGARLGFVKYVVARDTRQLLGCHIIGRRAADLVYAASVIIRRRGSLDDLATTVGIFPTLAEGVEGTARGLVRRLAPNIVSGPLAALPPASSPDSAKVCPACGAETKARGGIGSTVTAGLVDGSRRPERRQPSAESIDFQCASCAADFETQERLETHGSAASTDA